MHVKRGLDTLTYSALITIDEIAAFECVNHEVWLENKNLVPELSER